MPRREGTRREKILEATAAPRRIPQQDRSRARVDAILRTTLDLIGEGRDASMREIADAAEVPIASIYQYFPDKTALLHAVLVGFYQKMRARMEKALVRVERIEDVPDFADAMLDGLLLELGPGSAHINVWAAAQSQEVLRKLDAKEALDLAELVSARIIAVGKGLDSAAIRDFCVFAVVMAGPVVRQSLAMSRRDGQGLLRELKAMIRFRATGLSSSAKKK
jgi:AcrR family transcriptional regulator